MSLTTKIMEAKNWNKTIEALIKCRSSIHLRYGFHASFAARYWTRTYTKKKDISIKATQISFTYFS
jgi:hypothetical protein